MGKKFIKDFSWYFLGAFIPIFFTIIKTPIFTRHFDKEDYGHLGLVLITFSLVGMILFSWLSSCIWRYYPKYKKENKLKILYSNLFFLFLFSLLILISISSTWYILESNNLVKRLIYLSFLYLIFNQIYLVYMVVVRLELKVKLYTYFQSIRAFLNLFLAFVLVFVFNLDISVLVLSLFIIDFFAVLYLSILNPSKIVIQFKSIEKKHLKELLIFGSSGLLLNICFFIIASSDRYIIAFFGGINEVGIYDQVYKLSELSIIALLAVFFNTINPNLIHELEVNFNQSKYLIRSYLKAYFLIGFPIVFYLSLFSKDIANLLLGANFREGYPIMPFVFFAAYLHGISNFYELRLKFSNKLKKISLIIIVVTIINIMLTIILVGLFGYFWAAITTTLTYLLLVSLFHFFDKELLQPTRGNLKLLLTVFVIYVIKLAIVYILSLIIDITFIIKIALSIFFILTYIYILKDKILIIKIPLKN